MNEIDPEEKAFVLDSLCSSLLGLNVGRFRKTTTYSQDNHKQGKKDNQFHLWKVYADFYSQEFTKGQDLIRLAATRFATAYLTLGCLTQHKGDLMSMFSSDKWKKSAFSSIREGKQIQLIVMDSGFWTDVLRCLQAAMPLIKILRLVDSNDRPTMPFLNLELNEAMQKIKKNFYNVEKR
ncbi:hypothetical protein LINGRAHAP2_LOCUS34897 [Linum grandiflorum]